MKKPSDFINGIIATVVAGLLLFFAKTLFSPERELIYDINVIEEGAKGIYLDIVLRNGGSSPEENVTLKLDKRNRTELKEEEIVINGVGEPIKLNLPKIVPIEEELYYESSSDTIIVKAVEDNYIINFGTLLPKQEETLKGFFVGANISGYSLLHDELNIKSSNTKAEISYFSNIQIFYPIGFWLFGGLLSLLVVALIYEFNFTPHENRVKDAKKAYEDLLDKKDVRGNEKHNI